MAAEELLAAWCLEGAYMPRDHRRAYRLSVCVCVCVCATLIYIYLCRLWRKLALMEEGTSRNASWKVSYSLLSPFIQP